MKLSRYAGTLTEKLTSRLPCITEEIGPSICKPDLTLGISCYLSSFLLVLEQPVSHQIAQSYYIMDTSDTTSGYTVLQVLSLRLGIATAKSLPAQIRALFLRMRDHPRVSPYKWRRNTVMGGLYVLYALAELAIIATDLAELLGSAIALNL